MCPCLTFRVRKRLGLTSVSMAKNSKFLNTVVPKWVQSAKRQGKLIEL